MIGRLQFTRQIIAVILVIAIVLSSIGCANNPIQPELSSPDGNTITETVEIENIITEEVLYEHVTDEIYSKELVEAERKITEFLLEEETITEVLLCKTLYVSEDNIDDFAAHSQTASLFGDDVNISSLLKKIAIGTGVILTLVVLKKANLPKPIASMVVSAADKSIQFAKDGAIIGTLLGGFTGAANDLDSSGRTSSIISFAAATAFYIISSVSLAAAIPTGGCTLVVSAIANILSRITFVYEAASMIKTFIKTDSFEFDWNAIDWKKVGFDAAEQAINYGADGYVWGSVVGAVYGGAEGLDFYSKFGTPYSKYEARLQQTPKNDEFGHWSGDRGESDYIFDKLQTIKVGNDIYEIKPGTKVTYKNAVPDFSPFQKAKVKIPKMTNSRTKNFRQADEALAEYWTKIKYQGKSWTVNESINEIEVYRKANKLTWHEMNNLEDMQLVPIEMNAAFGHLGGVGEYNIMTRQEGVGDFD